MMSIAHPNDFPGAYIWGAQGQWFCYDTSTGPEIGQGRSFDVLTIDTEVQSYSRYWARKSALTDLEHIIAKLQSRDKKDEQIDARRISDKERVCRRYENGVNKAVHKISKGRLNEKGLYFLVRSACHLAL